MIFPPLLMKPIFKERIWGSDRLRSLFHKELPPGKKIGESWELADLPEGQSLIDGGRYDGLTMRQLLESYGKQIGFRENECSFPFGLLIKLLDANDILSVQVHPDEQACMIMPGAKPKTECWYIMDTVNNAGIYKGLKPGIDREKLRQAIKHGKTAELLQFYPVKKGDFHFLPAGTVHALGAGIIVAEIQTPSDTTFRLYDWDRVDKNGKTRQLHIEQALASIHYSTADHPPPADGYFIGPGRNPDSPLWTLLQEFDKSSNLADCPYFSVGQFYLEQAKQFSLDFPVVLMVSEGYGRIESVENERYFCDYKPGNTILLPAGQTWSIATRQNTHCLVVCLNNYTH